MGYIPGVRIPTGGGEGEDPNAPRVLLPPLEGESAPPIRVSWGSQPPLSIPSMYPIGVSTGVRGMGRRRF